MIAMGGNIVAEHFLVWHMGDCKQHALLFSSKIYRKMP